LINNLHTIQNPDTLLTFPLNISGSATSMLNPVLGWGISATTISPTYAATNTCICACIAIICF